MSEQTQNTMELVHLKGMVKRVEESGSGLIDVEDDEQGGFIIYVVPSPMDAESVYANLVLLMKSFCTENYRYSIHISPAKWRG